ncbi:Urease accessory protein UreG [Frankliniella fusca]|uniref:Urease accessory protein UreG n=1 Tax=Frankliniella fusca TaxID=407009 RepID=A0AAE1GUP8_9NEOP|nr:Urease accessory protein UreG [Frankliniella fusca]
MRDFYAYLAHYVLHLGDGRDVVSLFRHPRPSDSLVEVDVDGCPHLPVRIPLNLLVQHLLTPPSTGPTLLNAVS